MASVHSQVQRSKLTLNRASWVPKGVWAEVLELFGPDSSGHPGQRRSGAHRPLSAGSQFSQVGLWPRARTTAYSSSGCWDSSRGDPTPGVFLRESPRNSENFRTLPTYLYWESSPCRKGIRKTRRGLTRAKTARGGACQQWTGPGYKDPIRHPEALKLKAKFQPCPPHVGPEEPAEPFSFLIHWIRWEGEGIKC